MEDVEEGVLLRVSEGVADYAAVETGVLKRHVLQDEERGIGLVQAGGLEREQSVHRRLFHK